MMPATTTHSGKHSALVLCVAAACLLMGFSSLARAEDAVAARDHYERGTKFYDIGKYDDAIREFEAAYEAKSDPAFIFNLAQAHRLAGHNQEALQLYRNYLRYVPRPPNRADIDERIRALEKAVAERPASGAAPIPQPAVNPPATTAPPVAPVAGPAPPVTPAPGWPTQPNDPAPPPVGYEPPPPSTATSYPTMPATGTIPGPPIDHTPDHTPPGSSRRKAGVVIAAIGGGFFVVGAISGLVAWSESKTVEKAAMNHDTFDPSVESTGRAAEVVQWVGYGVGAAGVALGLILYANAPRANEAGATPVASLGPVLPMLGPGLGGALVRMSF